MSAAHAWISQGMAKVVAGVLKWRKSTIVIVLGCAVVCMDFAANNLGINTDTANMISPELEWRQQFIEYRDSFPVRDRNIVVVIDGPDAVANEGYASALAAALRDEPALFESVFLPGEGDFFERNGLLYLSLPELERLSDRLIGAQPFFAIVSQEFTGAGVINLVQQALTEGEQTADDDTGRVVSDGAGTLSAVTESEVTAVLTPLLNELAASLERSAEGARQPLAWRRLLADADADADSEESARQMLLLRPALDFNRIQPAGPAIERIRAIADDLRTASDADVSVRLTGTIAMEHEELTSVVRGASVAGFAALAMVTIVLLWALRSLTLMLIAIVTLLTGLTFTAAFAALTVGNLNLLSVAFAVLYVGLGVDFILHLSLRLKELLAEGHALDAALVETARGVGASLVICAVTTAAGFFAFVPTEFDGVSELGLISGTGMFISLIVSVILLPVLIGQFWRKGSKRSVGKVANTRLTLRLPSLDFMRPWQVAGTAAVLCAACALMLPGLSFDSNPIHLRDPESESIRALQDLAAESDAPLFDLIALADSSAQAEDWAARLRGLDVVDSVVTVASLVPDDQDEKLFVLEDLALLMGPRFGEVEVGAYDGEVLQSELEALLETLQRRIAAGSTPASAPRLERALGGWLAQVGALDEQARSRRLRMLDQDLRSNLPDELGSLARGLTARSFDLADLPPPLIERWVSTEGMQLVEIAPAGDINDNAEAARFVDAVRAVVTNATGLPVVYQEASATIVRSFALALFYAFVLVTVLLVVFLRTLRDTLLVLIPIFFAATVTAGVTVWLGLPLNFANIIALPLLVGVGVDSGIHMVHRMRTEPPRDGQPLHTSTSRAVLASGLTTIASFGNLAFSAHLGMSSMGQLLTIGMGVTLLATLVLLPALMRLRWAA